MDFLKETSEKYKKLFCGGRSRKQNLLKASLLAAALVGGVFTVPGVASYDLELSFPVKATKLKKQEIVQERMSFSYPQRFSLDADEQGRYGADYLAGFHLEGDSRIGCDVRRSAAGINFAKSDEEISAAIENDLEKHVKGFSAYRFERDKIGRQEAAKASFELIDPLASTLKVTQWMVSREGKHYLIVCGAGKGVYGFFEKDFERFRRSLRWEE